MRNPWKDKSLIMANNGYDQTYEDDRKENEETANLIPKALTR